MDAKAASPLRRAGVTYRSHRLKAKCSSKTCGKTNPHKGWPFFSSCVTVTFVAQYYGFLKRIVKVLFIKLLSFERLQEFGIVEKIQEVSAGLSRVILQLVAEVVCHIIVLNPIRLWISHIQVVLVDLVPVPTDDRCRQCDQKVRDSRP